MQIKGLISVTESRWARDCKDTCIRCVDIPVITLHYYISANFFLLILNTYLPLEFYTRERSIAYS